MKIGIVLGTRPEILKLAPIIFELVKQKINYFVIHTGQHYSENMDRIFWESLSIPIPNYLLNVREPNHARQTAEMLIKIDEILEKEKPNWVLVQGDTNSTMAGALAASKRKNIKIAHLEAGLRSFDRSMPEEINRIIVDHISDLLLAPTSEALQFLLNEGIDKEKCPIVGNTIQDMLMNSLPLALNSSRILKELNIDEKKYILLTIHRQENTEDQLKLKIILESLFLFANKKNLEIVFPVHPRTRKMIDIMNLSVPEKVRLIDPIGYFDFLVLQKKSRVIATDSGGIQEESCIMGVPCVTLRENTERPETLRLGSNVLSGVSSSGIIEALNKQFELKSEFSWKSPYGEGSTAERAVNLLLNLKIGRP